MAKKIYNKNAREAHLMAESYQRVVNEERITDVFYKYVDKIKQDIYNGMTFKESMISNKIDPSHWNNLLDIYTEYMEDKTEGPFETGFEDAEMEFDERGFAKNTAAGREDGNEPDNRNKGDTPWYDEKEAEDEQKELSHQDLIEWATQTGDGSLREEAYEALLAAYNEMERSKAALQAGQKPGGYYANM